MVSPKCKEVARREFLYRGFLATLGAAVEAPGEVDWERWRKTPVAELFVEAMDDEEEDRRFVEICSGTVEPEVDAGDFEGLDLQPAQEPLADLLAGFTRHLIEQRRWAGSRAFLGVDELRSFLNYTEIRDLRGKTGRSKDGRHLRKALRAATMAVPDPFVLVDYVFEGQDMWGDYRPHAMGALAMVAGPWTEWLAGRGLVGQASAKQICAQIRRDMTSLSDYLLGYSGDPQLAADVQAALLRD